MSINPAAYPANASFGYDPYAVNGAALSGSGFNGQALSGVGYAAPASGLGYYGGYNAAPQYGLGAYGAPAGYAGSVGYAAAAPVAGFAGVQQQGFQLDEQTVAEIESRLSYLRGRRQAVLRRQIIKVPGPGGRVQQVVRRLQTPPPDLIERVYVVKPQRDVVNLLIERPGTPPPQVQERRVVGKPHRPVINQQVVRVAPRTQVNAQQNLAGYGFASQPAYVNYAGYQPVAPVAPVVSQPYSVSYSTSYDNLGGYGGYAAPQANYGYAAPQASYGYAAQPVGYAAVSDPYAGYGYGYQQPSVVGYAAQPYSYGYGVQPSASGVAAYPAAGYGYQQPAYSGYTY